MANGNGDDQFAGREAAYAQTLGDMIGAFTTHIVEADIASKDAQAERILKLLNQDNVDFTSSANLVGLNEKLESKLSVPPVVMTDLTGVIIEDAELEMSMTVSAHNSDSTKIGVDAGMEASAGGGFAGFTASLKIHCDVSVEKEKKRESDYSATTNCKLRMCQGKVPEGVNKICDSVVGTVNTALKLNERLIVARANQAITELDGQINDGGAVTDTGEGESGATEDTAQPETQPDTQPEA